jgi:hypothetical protein
MSYLITPKTVPYLDELGSPHSRICEDSLEMNNNVLNQSFHGQYWQSDYRTATNLVAWNAPKSEANKVTQLDLRRP